MDEVNSYDDDISSDYFPWSDEFVRASNSNEIRYSM